MKETLSPEKDTDAARELIVVIEKDRGSEQIEAAETSTSVNRPTHGRRSRAIVRLSPEDARL